MYSSKYFLDTHKGVNEMRKTMSCPAILQLVKHTKKAASESPHEIPLQDTPLHQIHTQLPYELLNAAKPQFPISSDVFDALVTGSMSEKWEDNLFHFIIRVLSRALFSFLMHRIVVEASSMIHVQ